MSFHKVNYTDFKPENLVLGALDEKKFLNKENGKLDKYWRIGLMYRYPDGTVKPFLLEGPTIKTTWYRKDKKTFNDKDGSSKQIGADYSVRLYPLESKECLEYVKVTDVLREAVINIFIKDGLNEKCGYGKLNNPMQYSTVMFKEVCQHPKIRGTEDPDETKAKQEYVDAYTGTQVRMGSQVKNKDVFVEGKLEVDVKPLIKYTQLHVGKTSITFKKYLQSAVLVDMRKNEQVNYQEDTIKNTEVKVSDEMMKEYLQLQEQIKSMGLSNKKDGDDTNKPVDMTPTEETTEPEVGSPQMGTINPDLLKGLSESIKTD